MRRSLALVVLATSLGHAAGCGGNLSVSPPNDDVGTPRPNTADASSPDASGRARPDAPDETADAGPNRPEPGHAAGGGASEPCAEDRPDPAKGVFVTKMGTSGGPCSLLVPCPSIREAIATAKGQGKSIVYVAPGEYDEALSLETTVIVRAGWNADMEPWVRDCSAKSVRQTVIKGASPPVRVALDGTARLEALTIMTGGAAGTRAGSGESIYGVFATGARTRLELVDVVVRVHDAGDGHEGNPGDVGVPGRDDCALASAGTGASGAPGGAGSSARAGTFDETGYVLPSAGPGGRGAAGSNGHKGAADRPQCLPGIFGCDQTGATSVGCLETPFEQCGTSGTVGCGGGGGAGGSPGGSGGSSVALFAWAASVNVTRGALVAGRGGDGGNGAIGGAGARGGASSPGTLGTPVVTACKVVGPLTCDNTHGARPAGAPAGGFGGHGGDGAPGGGGAGGSAFSYYAGGRSEVLLRGTNLTYDRAGSGGWGNPRGASGLAAGSN